MFWWKNQSRSSLLWKQNWAYDLTMMYKDWGKILCKQFAKKKKKGRHSVTELWRKKKKVPMWWACVTNSKGLICGTHEPRQTLLSPVVLQRPRWKKKNASCKFLHSVQCTTRVYMAWCIYNAMAAKAHRRHKSNNWENTSRPSSQFFFQPHTHLCKQTQRWMRLTRK